ncbi:MAG: choice-of-anchor D domain-containing protein [Deltaproteobacteria bacterium]|nr:choice-of-anchor D domain-containing protein [Deltaproteobacteria bacterium]
MGRLSLHALLLFGLVFGLATTACECDESRISATLAELDADPDPVEFGDVPVSTVKEQLVTLTNRGTGPVHLHGLELSLNPDDFSLRPPEGIEYPYAIPPGNQVTFTVLYHPQDYPEQDEGAVRISSTDRDAPEYDLMCGGNAVEPVLLIQPVPVQFKRIRVLTTDPVSMTIQHTGSQPEPVTITRIEITDSGDGDFRLEQAPEGEVEIEAGEEIPIRLAYTPQDIDDADEGVLTIESTAESQEHIDIPLLGSSYGPRITVDTTAIDFRTVSVGSHPTISFSISNEGNHELLVTGLSLSASGSQKFSFEPTEISDPIQPLEEVEVAVTYDADDRGNDTGSLQIDHDDTLLGRPVFIELHGRTPTPDVEIQPDHAAINIAGISHTQTVDIRIYNLGDANLSVEGMAFDNPFGSFSIEAEPDYPAIIEPGSIPAGPCAVVTVRFTKDTSTVDDQCTLTFTTDDPDEQTVRVIIIGTYTP